jgi:hypothetical protein
MRDKNEVALPLVHVTIERKIPVERQVYKENSEHQA